MDNNESDFEYLSAAGVSRLAYDDQQIYFRRLLEVIGSDSEGELDEGDADGDPEDSFLPELAEANVPGSSQQIEVEIEDDDEEDEDQYMSDEVADNEEEATPEAEDNFWIGKDGTKWIKSAPSLRREGAHNIFRETTFVGPHPATKGLTDVETFFRIMSPSVQDIICRHTNKRALRDFAKWNEQHPEKAPLEWKAINEQEFCAYLGILLVMGCHRSNYETVPELWKSNALPLYRATMSVTRFKAISRFIRFDSDATRTARMATDKAAPIRDIFDMINSNMRLNFRPYESITVDEQLFRYRGHTKFTQYIPSKPAKYGIKFWWACDSSTGYPLNGQIYTGKVNGSRDVNQGERIVKELVAPYKNSGRNVTMDNFFTTLPLATELLTWKLTIVGTVKKNKRFLPREFKPSKERVPLSSEFGFSKNVALCSYVPKKDKAVVLLSTFHHDKSVSGPKLKPEIIHYYNQTKEGVDVMDKMLSQYTTKRKTYRWPQAVFYNLIDLSGLAAYIIFSKNNSMGPAAVKQSQRRKFIERLGENLCIPHMSSRAQNHRVTGIFTIRNAMECLLGHPINTNKPNDEFTPDDPEERDSSGRLRQKGGCFMCYQLNKKKRATRQACVSCKKPICAEHSLTQTKCEKCHLKK